MGGQLLAVHGSGIAQVSKKQLRKLESRSQMASSIAFVRKLRREEQG